MSACPERLPIWLLIGLLAGGCAGTADREPADPVELARPVVRATFEAEAPEVLRPSYTTDGLGGRALTGSAVWLTAVTQPSAGGTCELRLRLDRPAGEIDGKWNLLRLAPAGAAGADAFASGCNLVIGWGKGLQLVSGDGVRRNQALACTAVAAWSPGGWHHVAVAWRLTSPGRWDLALSVDGALVERLPDAALDLTPELILTAGSVGGRAAPGAIDDVRLYDHPRRYEVGP